jgi:hypothetical protein
MRAKHGIGHFSSTIGQPLVVAPILLMTIFTKKRTEKLAKETACFCIKIDILPFSAEVLSQIHVVKNISEVLGIW